MRARTRRSDGRGGLHDFEGSPEDGRVRDPEREGTAVVIDLTRVYGFLHGERFDQQAEPDDTTPG